MKDIVNPYFRGVNNRERLSPSSEKWEDIYGGLASDNRYRHFERDGGDKQYMTKYWQDRNGCANQVPLIRLTEMYHIAAEASLDSIQERIPQNYMMEVMMARNAPNWGIMTITDRAEMDKEIAKELRKETIGEGQMFYYYKRKGYASIPGSSVTADNRVYVLPMPDNEIEFGGRK